MSIINVSDCSFVRDVSNDMAIIEVNRHGPLPQLAEGVETET